MLLLFSNLRENEGYSEHLSGEHFLCRSKGESDTLYRSGLKVLIKYFDQSSSVKQSLKQTNPNCPIFLLLLDFNGSGDRSAPHALHSQGFVSSQTPPNFEN